MLWFDSSLPITLHEQDSMAAVCRFKSTNNNSAPNHGFNLRSVPSTLCSCTNNGLEVSHPWLHTAYLG
jgi:hypothetical protein